MMMTTTILEVFYDEKSLYSSFSFMNFIRASVSSAADWFSSRRHWIYSEERSNETSRSAGKLFGTLPLCTHKLLKASGHLFHKSVFKVTI